MNYLKLLFIYLPEFVELLKTVVELSKEGFDEIAIKNRFKKIQKAFKNKNRVESARRINDTFH